MTTVLRYDLQMTIAAALDDFNPVIPLIIKVEVIHVVMFSYRRLMCNQREGTGGKVPTMKGKVGEKIGKRWKKHWAGWIGISRKKTEMCEYSFTLPIQSGLATLKFFSSCMHHKLAYILFVEYTII